MKGMVSRRCATSEASSSSSRISNNEWQIARHALQQVLGGLVAATAGRAARRAAAAPRCGRHRRARAADRRRRPRPASASHRAPIALARRRACGKNQPRPQFGRLVEQAEQGPLPGEIAGHRVDIIDAQHAGALESRQRLGRQRQRRGPAENRRPPRPRRRTRPAANGSCRYRGAPHSHSGS